MCENAIRMTTIDMGNRIERGVTNGGCYQSILGPIISSDSISSGGGGGVVVLVPLMSNIVHVNGHGSGGGLFCRHGHRKGKEEREDDDVQFHEWTETSGFLHMSVKRYRSIDDAERTAYNNAPKKESGLAGHGQDRTRRTTYGEQWTR